MQAQHPIPMITKPDSVVLNLPLPQTYVGGLGRGVQPLLGFSQCLPGTREVGDIAVLRNYIDDCAVIVSQWGQGKVYGVKYSIPIRVADFEPDQLAAGRPDNALAYLRLQRRRVSKERLLPERFPEHIFESMTRFQ